MDFVDAIWTYLSGKKTALAAVGLVGLAVYQLTQHDFSNAYQTFMAALALLGVRHAIAKVGAGTGDGPNPSSSSGVLDWRRKTGCVLLALAAWGMARPALAQAPAVKPTSLMPWRDDVAARLRALEQGPRQQPQQSDPALLSALNQLAQNQALMLGLLQHQQPGTPTAPPIQPQTAPQIHYHLQGAPNGQQVLPGPQPPSQILPNPAPPTQILPGPQPPSQILPGPAAPQAPLPNPAPPGQQLPGPGSSPQTLPGPTNPGSPPPNTITPGPNSRPQTLPRPMPPAGDPVGTQTYRGVRYALSKPTK